MNRMRLTPAVRISLGLALFTMTLLMGADMMGFLPDPDKAVLEMRKKVCESLAVYGSLAIQAGDVKSIKTTMQVMKHRNEDILSAALRTTDGTVLAKVGDHQRHWQGTSKDVSTPTNVKVPIFKGKARWGTFEVAFTPSKSNAFFGLFDLPIVKLILLVIPFAFVGYLLFMRKTLRDLDPSAVVPGRVKAALDALVEGVVLLDNKERIVLVNTSFAKILGKSAKSLMGQKASELNWTKPNSKEKVTTFPWQQAMIEGQTQAAVPLALDAGENILRTFMVNGAPIMDGQKKMRGVLVTFDDVTEIEEQNDLLQRMLKDLEDSRDQVQKKNQKLKILATMDPLTGCLNRRSFFERFEIEFGKARRHGMDLSCVMIDIDHFKSINDNYGHPVGDKVLKLISETLRSCLRESDTICRYGGEEFCIILPQSDREQGIKIAERFRTTIETTSINGIGVTVSLGLSGLNSAIANPQELLSQADEALYEAKKGGRNCVVAFGEGNVSPEPIESQGDEKRPVSDNPENVYIPLQAANALLMALAYRDMDTAEHSRQVGDFCVATAKELMSQNDGFVLEIAGLLHDIGKLGVPDSILMKPGPLTEQEWEAMREHERRSVEVIASTFLSPELVEIVRYQRCWYSGSSQNPDLPTRKDIPLGSRILSIADAFSSMVSHRPYRSARSHEAAFKELRNFAGTQFDPDLVEHFVEVVQARDQSRHQESDPVPNAVKLDIGYEVERLLCAVNTQEIGMLASVIDRLGTKAAKHGLTQIVDVTTQLEKATEQECDMMKIMQLTSELMKVCGSKEALGFESEHPNGRIAQQKQAH